MVLPIPGTWGKERVAHHHESTKLVAGMFAQVAVEIALILTGKNRQLAYDLFAVACVHIQSEANVNCHCHPQAYAWLLVKQAFVSNDFVTFLARSR